MERIHVVGVGPRTGTTLIAECMAACFAIDAKEAHETRLTRHRWNADVYLTKYPADLGFVAPRLRLDRRFHVIGMLRDPRDVVVSRHELDQGRYWTPLRMWLSRLPHLRALRGRERFTLVRYEDLVTHPDQVQALIASRMPFLRETAPFSRFHEVAAPSADSAAALGGVRPIAASRIGNWRNHLPRLAGQIARHGSVAEPLIELGYEADHAWMSLLEGVVPDMRPSHWPEQSRRRRSGARHANAWLDALLVAGLRVAGAPIV